MNIIDKIIVSFKAREARSSVLGIPDNDKIFTKIAAVILILTLCALTVFSYFNCSDSSDREYLFLNNTDLLYQLILLLPDVHFFDSFALSYAFNVLLYNAILVLAYIFLIKNLNVKMKWCLVTALFLIVPLSPFYKSFVTFGVSYSMFIAAIFFFMGLFLRLINYEENLYDIRKTLFLFVIFSVFLGITAGIRAFLALNIPLILTSLYMRFEKSKRPVILGCVSFAACLTGHIINKIFNFWYSLSLFDYANIDNLILNLLPKLGECFINIAGFFGFCSGVSVISISGFLNIAAVIAAGFIIWITYKTLRKTRTDNAPQFISVFFAVALVFNIFIFIIASPPVTPRYFIPFLILYIPLCAIFFEHAENNYKLKKRIIMISFFIILILGMGCFNFIYFL